MADDHPKNEDARPEIARDDHGKSRKDVKESLHDATETMDESPAGSPNAEKQSRTS